MGSAIGGASPSTEYSNEYLVDVRDFGANTSYFFDNTPAFQAAVDKLAARLAAANSSNPASNIQGTVFVPQATSPYYFAGPVWVDSSFIEIRGEGQGTVLSNHLAVCHPLIIFGLRRIVPAGPGIPFPLIPDVRYRPDLFGVLDVSAASGPGQRRGYTTNGDSLIQCQGTPFDCGGMGSTGFPDNWAETSYFTMDVALQGPNGNVFPGNTPIFNIGVSTKRLLYPFSLYSNAPNSFVFLFCTQSERFGPLTSRWFTFSSGTALGLQRISIQIDLNAGVVSAFVNSVQVATNNFYIGTGFGSKTFFAENDFYPLLIGDNGDARPSIGNVNGFNFSIYGLSFSRSIRYQSLGVGQSQHRVDTPTSPITDLYRYFTPRWGPASEIDSQLIGYLTFNDAPGSRQLTIQGGTAASLCTASAFIIHSEGSGGPLIGNSVHNLQLIGGGPYGQNVAISEILELTMSHLRSTAAYHAIGTLSTGAHYIVRLEECYLSGTDSGYFALDQILWARNVTFATAGRATMRFIGCNVTMENIIVEFDTSYNQSTIKIHAGDYGGIYTFRNLTVDYEGSSYQHAAIYCENHPYAASTILKLEDVNLGTIGNVPIIKLMEMSPQFPQGTVIVDDLQAYTDQMLAILEVDGPNWRGDLKNLACGLAPRINYLPTFGTTCNVVINENTFQAPPRSHSWHSGAHVLNVPSPNLGQFTQWRCATTGHYGTSNPPLWIGLNPLDCGKANLACYVLNHGFITVSLT